MHLQNLICTLNRRQPAKALTRSARRRFNAARPLMLMRPRPRTLFLLLSLDLLAAAAAFPAEPVSARPGEHRSAGRDVESQNEKDWVDNRWSRTEVGQFLASLVDAPGGVVAKGLSIKVGERDDGTVCFDTANLSWRAAWTGGFLKFDAARFGPRSPSARRPGRDGWARATVSKGCTSTESASCWNTL